MKSIKANSLMFKGLVLIGLFMFQLGMSSLMAAGVFNCADCTTTCSSESKTDSHHDDSSTGESSNCHCICHHAQAVDVIQMTSLTSLSFIGYFSVSQDLSRESLARVIDLPPQIV